MLRRTFILGGSVVLGAGVSQFSGQTVDSLEKKRRKKNPRRKKRVPGKKKDQQNRNGHNDHAGHGAKGKGRKIRLKNSRNFIPADEVVVKGDKVESHMIAPFAIEPLTEEELAAKAAQDVKDGILILPSE